MTYNSEVLDEIINLFSNCTKVTQIDTITKNNKTVPLISQALFCTLYTCISRTIFVWLKLRFFDF